MSFLRCPFCGLRHLEEFVFHKTLPPEGAAEPWERLYLRVANLQSSLERWQHLHGCRAWLYLERNPSTGAVLDCRMLGPGAP